MPIVHRLSYVDSLPRLIVDAEGVARAEWAGDNVLSEPLPKAGTGCLIVWSGWFGESSGGPCAVWERDPRVWSPAGYERLKGVLNVARERLEHSKTKLLLRPHARHVLNDPQRCARFLSDFGGPCFGLALDPVSMLEPSMLAGAEDHVPRILERLAPVSDWLILPAYGVAGVSSGSGGADLDSAGLAFVPADRATLTAETIRGWAAPWLAGKRVIDFP